MLYESLLDDLLTTRIDVLENVFGIKMRSVLDFISLAHAPRF